MKLWLIRLSFLALLIIGVMLFHRSRQNRPLPVIVAAQAKILLAGNGAEVETLDPQLANGVPEHQVATSMFEGLVAPAPQNPDEDAPGAAASWEHKDFTVWTFHLQPQGKWSDGVPVTAHDFVFGFQRILSPELAADYGQMLYPIVNAEAFNSGTLKDFSQVGVKALDDLTLQITLGGPTPFLPGLLKHYSWFAMPKHVIEKFGGATSRDNTWARPENIVGNGPFKMKRWRFTQVLEVERNPYYWDAATVKLHEIHFFPIVSDATEERAFQDGQLHLTYLVPLSRISHYRQTKDPMYRGDAQLGTYFYRVNVTKPPFNNKLVRRALAMAIDRESLIENVTRAGQQPATGLTPVDCSPNYHPPRVAKFDPVEARRLLAEAGYPDGKGFPSFEILINTLEMHRTIAEAIQEMWKTNLNIPVNIINEDWQVYLDTQRKLGYSVCRAAWIGDYVDPMTFLSTMRSTDGNNNTGWKNQRYDELLNKSALEIDVRKRFDILSEAENLMLEEMPVIPIYWYVHTYMVRPELKNLGHSVLEHRCYKALDF